MNGKVLSYERELEIFLSTVGIFVKNKEHSGPRYMDVQREPREELKKIFQKIHGDYDQEALEEAIDNLLPNLIVEEEK